ncbi:HD domain-containing phosphohydrolase [Motiliproteus sp. MSK22-1]|uniref:HD domain-containing phosphohydrolase n=1 Tax=Motiliproteus sp. MSK22-1 TaxID=1897630 RepID=UPI00097633B3|nr:HD domain-containing phosphohydrolase [Motiliproteus sp. MSK22-1]OMH33643.1 two-component system response regulator [Motiliproteus sp. MSK22-1]
MSESTNIHAESRILVVDDNPANVLLLTAMLEEEGFDNVVSTTDPQQVLPLQQQHDFNLIMLDIRMPQMDGFAVLKLLQPWIVEDHLPIIVLTAQTDEATRLNALSGGAKDFVNKPFNQAEVVRRVLNLLEGNLYHRMLKLQNLELERKVDERTQELQATRLQVIRQLGLAGEYRDNETGMHVIRMSKFCELLAAQIGMDSDFCDQILSASPMHDLGKIGIPDRILLKPGKLDAEEWEIMKTHAQIGAQILSGSDSALMQMAHEIALNHHEKWDGSGYPNGLKGEDIPLTGRISAICDVFDALTSERSYKKAWTTEKAFKLIEDELGSHFDPNLARVFLDNKQQVLDIRSQFPDDEE